MLGKARRDKLYEDRYEWSHFSVRKICEKSLVWGEKRITSGLAGIMDNKVWERQLSCAIHINLKATNCYLHPLTPFSCSACENFFLSVLKFISIVFMPSNKTFFIRFCNKFLPSSLDHNRKVFGTIKLKKKKRSALIITQSKLGGVQS